MADRHPQQEEESCPEDANANPRHQQKQNRGRNQRHNDAEICHSPATPALKKPMVSASAPERRLAVLVAFAIERQAALTDLAVEIFDKLIGTARRRAEMQHDERLLTQSYGRTWVTAV